ncbi:ribose 5-phosphate isomerase B [candidate division KSB1 bacterium]|nr:ribose 5-phosphate isomerase B [candidate division KSB1 bacterium]RQW05428.1 MAG: ribose 5-phosphate isomerase B [candidate division KSB1 bacterium]
MTIAIGCDHAGFELKQQIIDYLAQSKIDYKDYGAYSPERVDYPDYGALIGKKVGAGEHEKGIIICGTGIGMSIAANKMKGARAALCTSDYMVEMARKHNDANILALGGRTTTIDLAIRMIRIFLNTEFEGGRHAVRVSKIHSLSKR